ncbi:hypothetical protein BGW37DRAFT_262317 [Umbelopsis sp. PMI_123]|nr:hypothetical protein BGW37DRAFT_262317 [Umbelopsis sp. PMI_123]
MSTTTPKDKSGKFWKKLGLGKQKSSGDRTPSRPDVANSLRIEPSESTRRNKRLSLISSHNHRRTISETTGNITRSHSAMNIVVPDDTRQVTRSLSRTMSVANTPVQAKPNEPEVVHINKNSVRSEDDNLIAQTAGTMQINSLQDPNQNCLDISDQNVTNTQVDETTPFPQPTDAVDSPSAPTTLDTTDQAIFQSSPTSNTNLDLSTAESAPAAPSRSNLPKLSSLRTSSSSIPRTSSGSSLRQQASCLRQPSTSVRTTSSHDTLSSPIPKTASLTIAVIPVISNLNEIEDRKPTATHTTNEIYYSLDEDQTTLSGSREQELLSDLERERAVIKVLQGQKTGGGNINFC